MKEVVPEGYEASYSGYHITNTKLDQKKIYQDISGTKTWKGDKETDRPASIVVKLINNTTGEVMETTATKDTNWTYDFGKVVVKDADGKTYSYRVEEVVPPGYKASYDGYNITNMKVSEKPIVVPPTPKPAPSTPPASPSKPVSTYQPTSSPKTFVGGYGFHILALLISGMGIGIADRRRRK